MFREMRRIRQQLTPAESIEILERNTAGVLAVSGDGGYPYAVPLSYVYAGGRLFFHCAKSGHKLDGILRNSKVSFCVVDQDQVVPAEYTTYFRSVIVFGRARILEDAGEKEDALLLLAKKYYPDDAPGNRQNVLETDGPRLYMVEITAEHITGKAAKELIRK